MPSEQVAHIEGNAGLIVQIAGDGNVVTAGSGSLHLTRFDRDRERVGLDGEAVVGTELIAATSQSIPVLGRDEVTRDLWDWLDRADTAVSVRVMVGPGGRGKTRLALKLCNEAVEQGWQAGFLRNQEIVRFQGQQNLSSWRRQYPTLIVIDYAASVAERIKEWLIELSDADPDVPPLRLLMLERSATKDQGWWQSAFGIGGNDGRSIRRLLDPAEPVPLCDIGPPDTRRAIITAALARAGSDLRPPEPGDDPEFDHKLNTTPWAGEPLFLMMAAELAREAGFSRVLSLPRSAVALEIADEERDRIDRIMAAYNIPEPFGRHMAAVVTLCQGLDREATFRAIQREKAALGFDGAGDRATVFSALQTALPSSDGEIGPILPDMVGEAVLLREWSSPDEQAVVRCLEDRRAAVVQTVIRTAQDYAIQGYAIPLGWLDSLGDTLSVELPTFLELLNALPNQTVKLRERSTALTEQAVHMLREQVGRDSSGSDYSNLAAGLNNLSICLSGLGHREDALGACQEAVDLYRALADDLPDAFKPNLASSLNNLSNRLSDLGRREEALDACQEAMEIRHDLAADRPDAFRSELAASLTNLSARLSDLGRHEEALTACQTAVDMGRALAAGQPDAFRPSLANALNSLSNRLSDLGRREDALDACQEAVDLHRALAADRPDAFMPNLASSLNNQSNRLRALGRREGALTACQEAVDLYRTLAADRPDAFRPDLATSLTNLSNRLSDLGRREEALDACQEAVEIRHDLAADRPNTFRPDLATCLNSLSNHLSDLGRREDALHACQEAVDLHRALAGDRPDAFSPDLAGSLNNLSNHLSDLGRRENALDASQEAVDLYRALAANRPDAFRPSLASSLNNLSNRLSALRHSEAAFNTCQEAVDLYRALAADRPDAFSPDLATSLGAMGTIRRSREDHAGARDAFAEALATLTPILAAYPQGVAPLAANLLRDYLQSCEAASTDPNRELLEPVIEILHQIEAMSVD